MKTQKNKKRNLFMSFTLMFSFLAASFKFDNNNIYWFWQNDMSLAIFFIISAIFFAGLWFAEEKKLKTKK